MNFQVDHMCIILHIDFIHIAFIAILAVQGSAIIYVTGSWKTYLLGTS